MTTDRPRTQRLRRALATAAMLALFGAPLAGQEAPSRPRAGELLTYRAVSNRIGTFGTGTLRVDGPEEVRGDPALRLSFDFAGRVGLFRVSDRSRSWVDRGSFASLRYERVERSPLGSRREEVEIFPEEGRWEGDDGEGGATGSMNPLDELSFLYFLRSLPLNEGDEYAFDHHFDPDRNPVRLRVLGRETVEVPAGVFETIVVEMLVRGDRVTAMRLHLTDDTQRIPVRIDSSAPLVGVTRLLLERAEVGVLTGG